MLANQYVYIIKLRHKTSSPSPVNPPVRCPNKTRPRRLFAHASEAWFRPYTSPVASGLSQAPPEGGERPAAIAQPVLDVAFLQGAWIPFTFPEAAVRLLVPSFSQEERATCAFAIFLLWLYRHQTSVASAKTALAVPDATFHHRQSGSLSPVPTDASCSDPTQTSSIFMLHYERKGASNSTERIQAFKFLPKATLNPNGRIVFLLS
ncbi:hypothetical protein IF1G_09877 [Cordyceps javanica]|uniref:Uncharacterized protein n=1 Tax=Cordyceps javanica TaxID=43265 RepID=A0A545UPI5_9HYPO|nr:hypothetical protein IF1G_09877 [Cordyceps javanica]